MKGSLLLYNLYSNNVTICSNFLNCLIFFYQSKQLTDYIYTDIYCKLSKCIGHMNIILYCLQFEFRIYFRLTHFSMKLTIVV